MEADVTVQELKLQLRQEVSRFCERDGRMWKHPVVQILRALQHVNARAVLFGGTLRTLLTSRISGNRPGRPRDIDIVVEVSSIEEIRECFSPIIARETRFGGLQLRHGNWEFDVWPISKTWAFVNDAVLNPNFSMLPETTFFNVEAVAIDLWPQVGHSREIYSGNDQFFQGLLSRNLEINKEENPFPELCVVRALVMASSLGFQISPRLARYIQRVGQTLTRKDIGEIQYAHYKHERRLPKNLKSWIQFVSDSIQESPSKSVKLPELQQLKFWPNV